MQLMYLRAVAQIIGLDSGMLGWAMLEKLVLDVEVGDEWTEVRNTIISGLGRCVSIFYSLLMGLFMTLMFLTHGFFNYNILSC